MFNILQSRKGQEGKVYMVNVVFYLALPVNTRLQVGLPQAKSPQHITACHTHLKMKCLQKKLRHRHLLQKKVSRCSLNFTVSPPVVFKFKKSSICLLKKLFHRLLPLKKLRYHLVAPSLINCILPKPSKTTTNFETI